MTARTVFLRRLPGHGFVPPEADVTALGTGLPAGADEAARRFAAEVRALAADFWALPPAERTARWGELAARPVGAAAAWLRELGRGRETVPAAQPEPDAAAVAAVVRELFALPPRARAARRVEWLTGCAADIRRWSAAARAALRADPALARLDRELFDWFDAGRAPERIGRQTWIEHRDRWRERRKRRDRLADIFNPEIGSPISLVFVGALIFLFVALRSGLEPTPAANPVPRFTEGEVRAFWAYERMDWTPPTPPPRYDEWIRASRPPAAGAP